MGKLQESLDRIREGFAKEAPAGALAVMHRATDDLRASGILDRAAKPGDALPPFELTDPGGRPVRSADLLAEGPLVVTLDRGLW